MPLLRLRRPEKGRNAPTFLYSTQLSVAWAINNAFYEDKHYCWCSPDFGNKPHSSSPRGLLRTYLEELNDTDQGGIIMTAKLPAIRRAAENILATDPARLKECLEILASFRLAECYPVLYVMAYERVQDRIVNKPWSERASTWSAEILVTNVTSDDFDILIFR